MSMVKDLKTKDGKIKSTKENLSKATIKIGKIFTPKYEKAVKDLTDSMDTTSKLTEEYFASIRRS